MKTLTSKQMARHERRRDKLAALVALSKLNNQDCAKKPKDRTMEFVENVHKKFRKLDVLGSGPDAITLAKPTEENSHINMETLREEYNEIKKHKRIQPKFRLRGSGENASLSVNPNERVPLMLTDIKHLLLHILLEKYCPYLPPRWYCLERCGRICQTTCLVFEGISLQHWPKEESTFSFSKKIFTEIVEIVTPSVYGGSLIEELASVPLSEAEQEDLLKKYGSMDMALETRKDLIVMIKAVFPIKHEANEITLENLSSGDKFPRIKLMLSACQLVEENYPLPLKGKLKNTYSDYVMTKDTYQPATANSPMFGLDCEMCVTNAGSELTRVSVVNEKHEIIYETFVKPYNDIINYLTPYSGVTRSKLETVTKRLEDVQKDLRELLPPDAILVGQSLNVDLHALKMMHPYIIDTSVIFNFTGERTRKPKLKVLAREFLEEDIQQGNKGHNPVEDSLASLKLVQLKLNKSLDFGDAVLTRKKAVEVKSKAESKSTKYASSIFNHIIQQKKTSVILGCDDITGDYHQYLSRANECSNAMLLSNKGKPKRVKLKTVEEQDEIITSLCESVNENNFAMAHMKLNIQFEDGNLQLQQIDKWIETVWNSLRQSSLLVVIFSGTDVGNGMALVKIKT